MILVGTDAITGILTIEITEDRSVFVAILKPGVRVSVDSKFRYSPAVVGAISQGLVTIETEAKDFGLGGSNSVTTIQADYTVKPTDYWILLDIPNFTNISITLPNPATMVGQTIIFKRIDSNYENGAVVYGLNEDNGTTLYVSPWDVRSVMNDGTNWRYGFYTNID